MLSHGKRTFPLSTLSKRFICKFIGGFVEKKTAPSPGKMSTVREKFSIPQRYQGHERSVWVEYIQLAAEFKPINLGQGFPDFPPPSHVTKALSQVAAGPNHLLNQYTRCFGHPRLVIALGKLYSDLIGRNIDPFQEVLVTSGAYEALLTVISGHISPGDEAVIIEPFFDCYVPMVQCSGGTPVFIPLKPNINGGTVSSANWVFDRNELASVFNEKTKLIIINTPHNPIGKVFSMDELTFIADLCKKWNVLCVSDEVYEWLVFKPNKHIRMATLPNMWERTITICSAGKSFSVTGWKIGWAYGPAKLLNNAKIVHQNCVYTCPTPLQEALAMAIELEYKRRNSPDCYFNSLAADLEPKRNFIVKFLSDAGMKPTVPEGGYFVVADWSPLEKSIDLSKEKDQYKDYRFTKWMTKNVGLLGIPPSAFYCEQHKSLAENYVRYCFIKKDKNLRRAAQALKNWKSSL